MEFIKTEPEPNGESYLTSAYDQSEITGVREDEDPLLVQYPFIKTENEVSCMAIANDIEPFTGTGSCIHSTLYMVFSG
jgi:hypothetical protein